MKLNVCWCKPSTSFLHFSSSIKHTPRLCKPCGIQFILKSLINQKTFTVNAVAHLTSWPVPSPSHPSLFWGEGDLWMGMIGVFPLPELSHWNPWGLCSNCPALQESTGHPEVFRSFQQYTLISLLTSLKESKTKLN